jgi:hypothetical protein
MCLSAEIHGEDARVLRHLLLVSRALRWTDQEYCTTTHKDHHIGYRRSQHSD